MKIEGSIRKMRSVHEHPVKYYLPIGSEELDMNALIGSDVRIEFSGEINCIRCGRTTNKSFSQGFCYPCFISAPETEECVLRPELCQAHDGIARDMEYAKDHCLIEQVVYLSLTSDLKVGVTRSTQVPTRWIDQGAVKAVELARTPNRFLAGQIEVSLKKHLKDKTNWRAMLKNEIPDIDLVSAKNEIAGLVPKELSVYLTANDKIWEIDFPIGESAMKISSYNFDKDPVIQATLSGIKGQYLLFEEGKVLNIRKFGGYKLAINFE